MKLKPLLLIKLFLCNYLYAVDYKKDVWPLLDKYCMDCHDNDTEKGRFSLENIDPNILSGDDFEKWRLVEEQLVFNEMPPTKKKKTPQPTAKERQVMLSWLKKQFTATHSPYAVSHDKLNDPKFGNYVDHNLLFNKRYSHVIPGPPRIWRIRPSIYHEQLRTLGARLPPLDVALTMNSGSHFKDYATSYVLDEAAASPLLSNAKKIAATLISAKSRLNSLKVFIKTGEEKDVSTVKLIEELFVKTLSRKPTDEESKRFNDFFLQAKRQSDFKIALKALITAILIQPEFTHRSEVGDGKVDQYKRCRLTNVELAYSLSYALGDSLDKRIFGLANAGKLSTKEQIQAVVAGRLAKGLKENPRIMGFFREYFNYYYALQVFKDKPLWGAHKPKGLVDDLEYTISEILKKDQNVLAELLTTNKYHVDYKLVQDKKNKRQFVPGKRLDFGANRMRDYQTSFNLPLDWKWTAEQPIEFRADERAGVLTHPAWLVAWSGNTENHPVQRGLWVRTHLLGGTVPDVPIGVDAQIPEKEHTTFRDRLKLTTNAPECWRCHRKMDDLGVVFEQYDHYGRFQRLDAGQPVRVDGEIARTGQSELDNLKVSGPTEMMQVLAKSEYVKQVFVRHVFRYYMGRNETLGDANTLQDAYQAYNDKGGSFKALVTSILSSDSFIYRQATLKTAKKGR